MPSLVGSEMCIRDSYYAEQRWDSSQQMPLRRDGRRTSDRSFNHCRLFSVEACAKASKRQELLYCTRGVMFCLACVDASIGQVRGTSCTRALFLRTVVPEVGCTSKWWAEIGELPRGYTSNNHFPCSKSLSFRMKTTQWQRHTIIYAKQNTPHQLTARRGEDPMSICRFKHK